MHEISTWKKPVALSLSLHTAVFSGLLTINNHDQIERAQELLTAAALDNKPSIYTENAPLPAGSWYNSDYLTSRILGTEMGTVEHDIRFELPEDITKESTRIFMDSFHEAQATAIMAGPETYTITIVTNSRGGNVPEGYQILNEIGNAHVPPRILCDTEASSMAAMILLSQNNVTSREATSECQIMIHAPYKEFTKEEAYFKLNDNDYAEIAAQMRAMPTLKNWAFEYTWINNSKSAPLPEPHVFTKEELQRYISDHLALKQEFIEAIATNSHLNETDVELLFDQGDVYFNAMDAYTIGFIDKIENVEMDDINKTVAKINLCTKQPDISICRNDPMLGL